MTKLRRKPTKLTPQVHKAILDGVGKGMPIARMCSLLRITRSSYYEWLRRGRDGEEPYAALVEDLEHVEAELEKRLIGVVMEAAIEGKNWIPAMTILERKWPENYGRNRDVTVTHRSTNAPALEAVNVIDVTEELDRRLGNGSEEEKDAVESE